MPAIKKATIKSYDAATHKAAVQLAGSLGVWLDAVRVATDIPAADVVAGRQCTVLFLDPANQDDAVVLTIQGALPSGGGGGVTDHALLTNLAYATAAHTGFAGTGVANTFAALQTFSAGLQLAAGQTIRDSGGGGGTGRILLATASPHLTLTGDVQIDGKVAIQSAVPAAQTMLTISPTFTGVTAWKGVAMAPTLEFASGNSRTAYGLSANASATIANTSSGHSLIGLDFLLSAAAGAGVTAGILEAAAVIGRSFLFPTATTATLNVTALRNYKAPAPAITAGQGFFGAVNITDFAHFYAAPWALSNASVAVTRARGIHIEDISGTSFATIHLLELGPATPYFRVVGGAAPGANLTNVYVNENGTLRRVQWKAGNALVAGDKVMVLV